MIPVRDDVSARGAPLAVIALLVANVGVFLYEVKLLAVDETGESLVLFVETWGLVPRELLRGGAWTTVFTSMFVHSGLLHLSGNLLYLWIFGRGVEGLLGPARLLVLYLASGLAAAVLQVASAPHSFAPVVGASGAISGILGAYLTSFPRSRLRLLWPAVRLPAAFFLLLWIAIQIGAGLESWGRASEGVAWWAHVGGFAAGLALGRALWLRRPARTRLRI